MGLMDACERVRYRVGQSFTDCDFEAPILLTPTHLGHEQRRVQICVGFVIRQPGDGSLDAAPTRAVQRPDGPGAEQG